MRPLLFVGMTRSTFDVVLFESHIAMTGMPTVMASVTAWESPIGSVTTTTSGSM